MKRENFVRFEKILNCIKKTALIPPTVKLNDEETSVDDEKAEVFNRYFVSVISKCEKVTTTNSDESLSTLTCSEKEIGENLCDLNPDKSTRSNWEPHFKEMPQNIVQINEITLADMHKQLVVSYILENKPGNANV